ncbi:MAG: bifunctional riboflavin kinase/FAD synthetase [Flavobacteriales bacterium]|nr:bifunctional riboflavin kinase/FAD synthetase [Flavobacteriales bacterium]
MKVYRGQDYEISIRRPVVTPGTFDGVHIGHRKIIERIKQKANEINGESVVLTFEPHPRLVLFPDDNQLRLLTTLDEKLHLLEQAGVEHVVVIPFNLEFSRLTAVSYVENILVNKLHTQCLVIGYDHQFGRNREGSIEQLQKLAPRFGFEVEEIPPQDIDDIKVSSTKIRNALLAGDIQTANTFLTYLYNFEGTVVKGNQIGRTLGYPTANIQPTDTLKLIPGIGIYAVQIDIEGKKYKGMMSIGKRPTVEETDQVTIEVHVFDWSEDLYNQRIRIYMVAKMRNEEKYNSLEELKEQLILDEKQARELLKKNA